VGQTADQFELEPLVHFLGPLVVAEHVGGQGEGELGRAAAAVVG
jgi:hypothetical protein